MKFLKKVALAAVASSCLMLGSNVLAGSMHGNDADRAISGTTISMALKSLGLDAKKTTDIKGNPHFYMNDINGAKSIGVFMQDCGTAGCEDIILYADLGKAKVSDDTINEWNHVGSKLRSKMSRSSNGSIGISMPMSFYTDKDHEKVATLMGLFAVETKLASDTLSSVSMKD